MPMIKIEGQNIPLADELCATDDDLKRTLAPMYPDVTSAEIRRERGTDGQVIIHVVKRAGPKGAAEGAWNCTFSSPDEACATDDILRPREGLVYRQAAQVGNPEF
jgi:hypothetical protein